MVAQWAYSVFSDLRNLRLAGVLKKSSAASMVVPTGVGGGSRAAEFAVFGFDLGRMRAAVLAAGQGQAADGGDACQAFAAKAHAGDVFQIV